MKSFLLFTLMALMIGFGPAYGKKARPAAKKAPPAAGKGVLIGGGYPGNANLHGLIMKSIDGGKTWKETWFKDKEGNTIFSVKQFKELNKIFAVGRAGILYSTNGDTWTEAKIPKNCQDLRDIAYGNGMLVAVGASTNFLYSTDGGATFKSVMIGEDGSYVSAKFEQWNNKIGPVGKRHYYSVLFVKDRFITTGNFFAAIHLQPKDGELTFLKEVKNDENVLDFGRGLVWDGKDKLFIVGNNLSFQSSDAGETWSAARKLKEYNLEKGVYAKNLWVACGSFGALIYSKDGKTWEKGAGDYRTSATTYYNCTFGDGKFYGVMNQSDEFVVSSDGITWSTVKPEHHADNEEKYTINFYAIQPVSL